MKAQTVKTAKSLLLCFHLTQLPCKPRGAGVRAAMDSWSAPDTHCKANSLTWKKKRSDGWHLGSWTSSFKNHTLIPITHVLITLTQLRVQFTSGGGVFPCPFVAPHRYPPPPPLRREVHSRYFTPPHVKRSHWLTWPTPSTILMELADASSLPFKIYVPTRLAINHGTCSVGSKLQQEASSRPIHYRGFGSTIEPHPHDWLEEHQQDW